MQDCKVYLAHDYLNQRGGAERVAIEIARALNPTVVLTSIYSPEDTFPEFQEMSIRSTILSKIPLLRRDARLALPFLAFAWSLMRPVRASVVVCSSSGWAHGVPTSRETRKIVYCHNPARWLYQSEDYLIGRPWGIRAALGFLKPFLIRWDKSAAKSADVYIANSSSVAARIKAIYGRDASILFPPVCIDPSLPGQPVASLIGKEFFLMVGRPRGYKGAQPMIEAFSKMPEQTLVIAGGGATANSPDNIISTGYVSEAELRWLYANARALISVSREDFGLTPVEANAFGTPVLLLRAGGFLDTTAEGVSGLFIEDETPDAICRAVQSFPRTWDAEKIRSHAEKFSAAHFHEKIRALVEPRC